MDPKTGTCQYLLRNSWGTKARTTYASDLQFEGGYLWIPEDRLNDMLYSITYLE